MGLELVGGGHDHGASDDHDPKGQSDRDAKIVALLAEAELLLAGSRQRLQALVGRAADLRRRLNGPSSSLNGENDSETPPPSR
jgi:hypothetical protein